MYLHLPLWGAYTLVYFGTVWVTYQRKLKCGVPILAITLMYILCFISTADSLQRAYSAYIFHAGTASEFFLTSSDGRTLNDTSYGLLSAVGDALILWRLWIIWSRDIRILVVPCLLYIMGIACVIITVVIDIKYASNPNGHFAVEWLYNSATEGGLGISVALSCLVTALIIGKIWWVRRQVVKMLRRTGAENQNAQTTVHRRVTMILVESGALYTLVQAAYMASLLSRSTVATSVVSNICPKVLALAPTLIVLLQKNMDEEYDVIVLGTGLTECILSGLLSVEGKKVLHMDRNDYYGGDSASLNLTQLYRKFRPSQSPPAELGRDRDYAIDLIPKFIIASGELTKILVHTDVTRYLEFKQIAGSFVYRDGAISKVPSTEMEAVKSSLMGLFEKRRAKNFFSFLQNWKDDDPVTHQGINLDKDSMKTIYEKFGLEPGTQDFVGHAMALYLDDDYITKPARPTYERIILYTSSMARYGKSPYIYPLYGLGELPQSFARLSAIYGGTYMLDKSIDEIVVDADGKFVGVKSGNETVKAKQVIGDPSYFGGVATGATGGAEGGKVRVVEEGKVVRAICILKHPIPNTENADSAQIVIPQKQVKRKHDIYIAAVSSTHNVAAKDVYIAIVSTIVETDRPEQELAPGLSLLGPIHDKFVSVTPLYTPTASGQADNIFITRSYDATSHFETVVDDVHDVWKRVIGAPLVLKKREEVNVQE
ncbi:Rab GDP dissociation inhibitor alpha [Tulasnella sp. 330]|nr:Rab GDP dissociation inhibitor alpha [Tulasnella sp. 330]